jgi:hypothetical protein
MVRPSGHLLVLVFQPFDGASFGTVWFSFFLTSFSENLAEERIWLCRESEYH